MKKNKFRIVADKIDNLRDFLVKLPKMGTYQRISLGEVKKMKSGLLELEVSFYEPDD